MPLDGSKQSPCRSTRHPEKLCAAKDRMATRDQCSLYNECDGTDCLSCLGSGMEPGGVAATTRRDCGWDVSAKTCNSTSTPYSYTTFPVVWGDAKMCPEVCGAHTTCAECGAADGCGWCGGGNNAEPLRFAHGVRAVVVDVDTGLCVSEKQTTKDSFAVGVREWYVGNGGTVVGSDSR